MPRMTNRKPGIGFVAPSGQVLDAQALDRASTYFSQRGWKVVCPPAAWRVHERFAGTDAQRVGALHAMAAREDIDVVMAVRGGYGLSRLLPAIDWQLLGDSGKVFCGMSDFSALSLGLYAQQKVASLAGPTAIFDFGVAEGGEHLSDMTESHFWNMLVNRIDSFSFVTDTRGSLEASGVLWGSNLAMVTSLIGTPYLPQVRGGILFLEDINEHPFRVERMLYQLLHAGILAKQKAVLLGDFSGYKLYPNDNGYDMARMVAHFRTVCPVPVITGLPFGHIADKLTLPIGGKATLHLEKGRAAMNVSF
jgi:muramoyltetrapeptide carboxypeptidase